MERNLAPNDTKLEALRSQGVVPRSLTAVRLAGGSAALVTTVGMCSLSDIRDYYSECTSFTSCRISLELLGKFAVQVAAGSAAAYVVTAAVTALFISRFYFRVSLQGDHVQSTGRRLMRGVVCTSLGVLFGGIIVSQAYPSLFELFNVGLSSAYSEMYMGFFKYLHSVSWIWAGAGILTALGLGGAARLLFLHEHAMSREEILRDR